ncbi:hypothetical protein [Mesorhizobium sp. BH1-1-4]|uniref:hypothetical protein n=1 Tax=Mesorhizobium sp. BH1-1-4 TaxID=2876662 RepID=UPI001CD187F8|nr:hypothetical protein [Mesorhizobium sp. BH1-1-4]MBZ9993110.1 hypothetical protein [Mesorhizobium sp. BH1-1-4]
MNSPSGLHFAPSSASNAGLLACNHIIVSWLPYARPNKYQIVANVGGTQKTIGEFVVPNSPYAGRLPVVVTASGPFTVAGSSAAMTRPGSISLFSTRAGAAAAYDAETMEMLGAAGTTVSVEAEFGAGA